MSESCILFFRKGMQMNANHLLRHLDDSQLRDLRNAGSEVTIMRDGALPNCSTHLYFPVSGMISLVVQFGDRTSHEVGCVGNEGVSSTLGLESRYEPQLVAMGQIPGRAQSIPLETVQFLAEKNERFGQALKDYAARRYFEACLTAACNAHHNVPQRLAKWILIASDRVQSQNIPLTHDYLAMMLGTRRATVTIAAQRFAENGWMTYRRGHIEIKQPEALRRAACECYEMNPFRAKQTQVSAAA